MRRPRRYAFTWQRPAEPTALPVQFLSTVGLDDALLTMFAAKVGMPVETLRQYGEAYARTGSATGLREGYAGVAAGAAPFGVPTEGAVNLSNVDAELLARVRAMYDAAPPEAKRNFAIISGFRTYAQQADIWRRSRGGTLFAAAPPGSSRHERGPAQAMDIRDPTGWFHAHGRQFGVAWPVRGDYPHTQLDPAWRGPSFAKVSQAGAGPVGGELIGGATVPEGTHQQTLAALNEVASRQGIDPAAIAMMVKTESNWDPGAATGSYRGLTQIGPEQAAWQRIGRMSPADQIRAYDRWLDYYDFRGKRAQAGVDFSRMDAAEQAAYLQGFQFAPNALGWQRAYGQGIRTVPTTETAQARALGDTTMQAMTGYYRHLMRQSPPIYRAAPPAAGTLVLPEQQPVAAPAPAPAILTPFKPDEFMALSDEEARDIALHITRLSAELAELRRRLGGIVRHGKVTDVDPAKQLARIELSTDDESKKSAWVPYAAATGGFKQVWHPSVGQNMTLVAPNGDPAQGFLLPLSHNDQFASPSNDGGTHVLADFGKTRVEVKEGELNLKSTTINLAADKITVDGKTYLGNKDASEHVLKESGPCEKVWGF